MSEENTMVVEEPKNDNVVESDSTTEPVTTMDNTDKVSPNVNDDEDEMTEAELQQLMELERKYSRRAFKLTKASKEEKKEMFSSTHVVTETGELQVETEATMLREDMLELNASAQAGRILDGEIIGCRSANPDSPVATILAEVAYGNGTCTVLIPSFVLFNYDIEKYRTKETQKSIEKRVEDMIGAKIKFVVKSFDQKTKTAYADRLRAMDSIAYANFRKPTREGRPRVVKGMLAEGRIVAVRKDSLVVYVLGSEAVIKKDETSWFYVSDLREHFTMNQMVTVKVLEIKEKEVVRFEREKYTLVLTALSIKQATANPMNKWFEYFAIGGKYQATITGINESGTGVFVTLQNRAVCMCAYPKFGALPVIGQQRVVEVTEKKVEDDGTKKIFGIFANL